MERCIISANRGGLSNRIKCLVSSLRLADRRAGKPFLYWPKDIHANCYFSDLFENKFNEIDEPAFRGMSQTDAIINSSWRFLLFQEEGFSYRPLRFFPYKINNISDIDFRYNSIPLGIREEIIRYINMLTPRKDIFNEVERFSRNFDDTTISVQVRTWHGDLGILKNMRDKLFDIRNLFKTMDMEKENRFFVVCDSKEVMGKILDRYGERVLFYPRDDFENNRYTTEGMRVSLIILLLLARNNKIIVSYFSTFSELAWWLGRCRADIRQIPVSLSHRLIFLLRRHYQATDKINKGLWGYK